MDAFATSGRSATRHAVLAGQSASADRPRRAGRVRRWPATVIVSLFFVAVAAAASVGWWYARESPAHQGPIVLISVDAIQASDLPAYGGQRTDTPAIDTLAADAIVFERAYTHSSETLPAHASMLSGQLPPEHGVRGDVGFVLDRQTRTLAELLRNRGFDTGAAVSTFLLRPESGIGQGFAFFDAELPESTDFTPAVSRPGAMTLEAAERWLATQDGQRFFLFLQVTADDADTAVTRVARLLKDRELYDEATIVLVGDRGDPPSGVTLDDATLRVPLLVKQPGSEGAGRRIASAVQHIDLAPTILDLVRAPVPGNLRGRSLRGVLDSDEGDLADAPVYSESLVAYFQFGGDAVFALTSADYRYLRAASDELLPLVPRTDAAGGGESAEAGRLRAALDAVIGPQPIEPPAPMAGGDEDRYALFGYLPAPWVQASDAILDAGAQHAIAYAHRTAAVLIGQKKYSAGIRTLQAIVRDHPELAGVHYQLGIVFVRTGRLAEAIAAFGAARDQSPNAPELTIALADALMRDGRIDAAWGEAAAGIALAEKGAPRHRAAAHELAARVALARNDGEAAITHASIADEAAPDMPMSKFVQGRLAYEDGHYEEASRAFEAAVDIVRQRRGALSELHLYFGESLTHLARYPEAEAEYREELRQFPRNLQAYTSLAMLYRASNRDDAVEDVLNELVAATPTPEGYGVAAQLWTMLGDRSRAEALRSDARARFRGDPSLALLGRDGRR
jgi:arylsulfatase A-like enzyme